MKIAVQDLVAVGSIVKAFGVRGDVIVRPLTDAPKRFRALRKVYLATEASATGTGDAEPIVTEVVSVREGQRGVRIRFTCAPDRTEAERLVGRLVMIPPEETVSLPPGTFFVHQVIGLCAMDEQGEPLGVLAEVLHLPAQDVYVIRSEGHADLLVPAVREFVRSVDVMARTVTLHIIEGMRE